MFPPSRAIKSATLGCTSTTNACEVDDSASPTRRRSMFTAAVCGESTTPAPLHVGQGTVIVPRNPSVTFLRVISTKPRGESSTTSVSYTHLRAHETKANNVCRTLLEKKKKKKKKNK